MPIRLGTFIIVMAILSSCKEHGHEEDASATLITVNEFPTEVRLPTSAWDLLEQKKMIDNGGEIIINPEASKKFEENVFIGVTVKLKEKTPGVLGGKDYEISAPKYGLNIDLSQYLKMDKGTFYFFFEPKFPLDPNTGQILFLGQSIPRVLDGQPMGSKCDQFYDLTHSYFKEIHEKGIEVNVTEGRHVSLLAGTFFIRVAHQIGVRTLTQLSITDSRFPDLLCERSEENSRRE